MRDTPLRRRVQAFESPRGHDSKPQVSRGFVARPARAQELDPRWFPQTARADRPLRRPFSSGPDPDQVDQRRTDALQASRRLRWLETSLPLVDVATSGRSPARRLSDGRGLTRQDSDSHESR
jgi:hypothetical protein